MTKTKLGDTRSLNTADQLGRSTQALAYLRDGKTQTEAAQLTGLSRFTANKLAQALAKDANFVPTQAKRGRKSIPIVNHMTVAAAASNA